MSDTIMSVQELIDTAFPDEIKNSTINLRLLKTVIIIIANQLRVLNRQVQVSVDGSAKRSQTSLRPTQVVSEIKIIVEKDDKKGQANKIRKGSKGKEEITEKDGKGKVKGRIKKKDEKKRDESHEEIDENRESIKSMQLKDDSPENKIRKASKGKEEITEKEGKRKVKGRIKQKDEKKRDESYEETDENRESIKSMQLKDDSTEKAVGGNADPTIHEGASIHDTKVDDLEELREREIRIISQRADSHEDPALTPSPMASVHSFGKENILIVSPQGHTPRINVVTKEQFEELANIVHELEARFDPIGIPNFPENADLLKALRSGASLTEAMAAFQLSARLKTYEKGFEIMLSLLTDLAKNTPGINVTKFQDLESDFARGLINENSTPVRQEHVNDWISRDEFNNAMHELYEEVMIIVKKNSKTTGTDNKSTEMLISQLERKIEAQNYAERIRNVEEDITEYAEKFVHLDISLSSQIGSYQEQLTQLQYQLDTAIENMMDKVADVRTAPEALMELNTRLDALQQDLENAIHDGNHLRTFQNNMTLDLARLWKEIELIRDAKADREEMTDALRDKAGIENLNGMVSTEQFDAVCADLQAKINASYKKFNSQELVWQLALDDLDKTIREKGDWVHICTLRDDINRHLNSLQDKVNALMEVVGEPHAAAIRKKLFRDTDCVCCGTPATMNMEVPVRRLPGFKRASADGAEADVPKEDGDYSERCVPGRVIHKDSRSHICQRFCGGSHTLIPRIPPLSRAPPDVTITHLPREVTTTIGSDGKAYQTDEKMELKPCVACNAPRDVPRASDNTDAKKHVDEERNSSFDIMGEMSWLAAPKLSGGSNYPPLFDEDI